jgi:hypothetical protein
MSNMDYACKYYPIRQSTRLPLEIRLRVTGLSPEGRFSEDCRTVVVNAHGCGAAKGGVDRVGNVANGILHAFIVGIEGNRCKHRLIDVTRTHGCLDIPRRPMRQGAVIHQASAGPCSGIASKI